MEVFTVIMSIIGSLISGGALFFFQRQFKKKDAKDEERDRAKARENILIIKSIKSVGELTVATAEAVKAGHANGEVTKALEGYAAVDKEMYDYLLDQNANK